MATFVAIVYYASCLVSTFCNYTILIRTWSASVLFSNRALKRPTAASNSATDGPPVWLFFEQVKQFFSPALSHAGKGGDPRRP